MHAHPARHDTRQPPFDSLVTALNRQSGRVARGVLAGWVAAGLTVVGLIAPAASAAQVRRPTFPSPPPFAGEEMTVLEYDPRSTLVVPGTELGRARYPFIDVHLHLDGTASREELAELVAGMDSINLQVGVNLSGGTGDLLAAQIRGFEEAAPGRIVVFANVDFTGVGTPGFGERAAAQLESDFQIGARGLKIFKDLGMYVEDVSGQRVGVDDPRLDPIWEKAGELGMPVLIHTADPAEFWAPMDQHNERWLELRERPRRKQEAPPTWEELIGEQMNLFRRHPNTHFIAAHLGWMGNDLARLGSLLDEIPNMHTELGAVIYEPGRQPRFAREFFIKYQDRILMGKDRWDPGEYSTYFRVLETDDEYFPYYRKYHAFWRMYGLDLPDEVLRKVYFENALKLVPGLDATRFPGG
ncbi:MAG: amidohydrolase family protein [Gemmatimonadetes bacterium]|nr:amidohydrolase family protein [Gemmatimonadota bacterium]